MLLNAVIIILREVLEAALIISVFLALSQLLNRNLWWMLVALVLGFGGAYVYAVNLGQVSMMAGGTGQEIVNACLHSLIFLCLLLFMISVPHQQHVSWRLLNLVTIILAVITAIVREGSEIILYINGFIGIPDLLSPVLMGGAVGAGIGLSVGVFFYYLLVNMRRSHGIWLGYLILLLIGGSMVAQAVEFMIQADYISATTPIWDSSHWISERSAVGQLLYALVGYEATPAPQQAAAYFISIGVLIAAAVISYTIRGRTP
ncbi:FTR1 family protein [uncultured Methylophaga sp.]|uniref:FTR1 family protein n=1 Tax=uncultured Methylophaga sp. TaxID=285271 RepID=UPI00261085E2|nr:FTR1 family protein [uncultured Methylophaga sp.]